MANLKATITKDTWNWIISNGERKAYFMDYVADGLRRAEKNSEKVCVSDFMYNAIYRTMNKFDCGENSAPWDWAYIRDNFSDLGYARKYNKLVSSK